MEGTNTETPLGVEGTTVREGEYTRMVEVTMTDAERGELALTLTGQLSERRKIDAEKAESMAEYKKRYAAVESIIEKIANQIDREKIVKPARCMEIANKEKGVIEVHNLDLKKTHDDRVVTTRPMNIFELSGDSVDTNMAMMDAADEGKKRGRKKKDDSDHATSEPAARKMRKSANGSTDVPGRPAITLADKEFEV